MLSRINPARVRAVASVLSEVPALAIDVVETSDPQYTAVKSLVRLHGSAAAALVVANALISYRLSLPGEAYWSEFAEYFASKPTPRSVDELIGLFSEFLEASRGNRMMRSQKLARLRRAAPVLSELLARPQLYVDLGLLVRKLASVYSAQGYEKTIVFAAKMLHYVHRASGVEEKNVDKIPVPIDRRMALLTYTSGLVDAPPHAIMTKHRAEAVEAWSRVAAASGIASVSLDAVVWLPAYRLEPLLRRSLEEAREAYAQRLVSYTRGLVKWGVARRIAAEILWRD